MTMQEKNTQETIDKVKKMPDKAVSMKPLFSWQSVFILGVGLIVGALIALVYWILSPSITGSSVSSTTTGTDTYSPGLLGILGMVPKGPYQSQVNIQVVSPGSQYIPLSTLQQRAEYYSAKAISLPFFEYLSQQLKQQMPGFSANVDQLGKTITSLYDSKTEVPVIRISVTAPTEAEAISLAELVPQDFITYLVSEEKDKVKKDYDATLGEIDAVKTALHQAQQELVALKQNDLSNTNPDIIILKAKVDALQQVLNTQISQLSTQSVADLQIEYDNTLEQMKLVNKQIGETQSQMHSLQPSNNTGNTTTDQSSIVLDAKIRALQAELDRETTAMVTIADTSSVEYTQAYKLVQTTSKALADARTELNAIQAKLALNNQTTTPDYQILQIKLDTYNSQQAEFAKKLSQLYSQIVASTDADNNQSDTQTQFNKTTLALAQAKKDLDTLETQMGYDRLYSDLNLSIAQSKVDNLNSRLTVLTGQLGSLTGGNINTLETDYLVAGNPSAAHPILPKRSKAKNILIMGAIAGIIIAWALWNFKWISKGMPAATQKRKEEQE